MSKKEEVVDEKVLEQAALEKEMEERYNERIENLNKGFEEMEKLAKEAKYQNQIYPEGSKVEVDGHMFSGLLNMMSINKQILERTQAVLFDTLQIVESLMQSEAEVMLYLMRKHFKNVDDGITVKQEPVSEKPKKEK